MGTGSMLAYPPATSIVAGRALDAVLRVPLLGKLAGANALVALAAAGTIASLHLPLLGDGWLVGIVAAAMLLALAANLLLVHLALRPLARLERTAERVAHGDLVARVGESRLADRNMARVGRTLDALLDALVADRARMRRLTAQVIAAQDGECSRIARALHESVAQTLAGLMLHLTAAARTADASALPALEMIRDMAVAAMDEVQTLSHTVYPRVLEDLGLEAALEWLARRARERGSLQVAVHSELYAAHIPSAAASVLYGVALESLRNAERHGGARTVRFTLGASGGSATLEVDDDGCGFSVEEAVARSSGIGLFAMRERIALVDGRLDVQSWPGTGTHVVATVPLHAG